MGLLDALQDKGFRSDVADGLRNALNRGLLGGVLGAPVDLATMALRPLGYKVAQPVMGSDWIGQKLQDAGMVSSKRNHLAEMMAGLLDPATMATGAVKAAAAAPMVAGMFIGKGAKTWDALQAAKALELEKAGTPARQIWSETGTWKGPDGMWRQEIPDNKAATDVKKVSGVFDSQLGKPKINEVIDHAQLFQAYPELSNIRAHETFTNSGEFFPNKFTGGEIGINPRGIDAFTGKPITANSTTVHELQHAIQEGEGFARGGSPSEFSQQDVAVTARDMLNWQRDVASQLKKDPLLDWKSAESLAAKEYESIGWPEAIPSPEIRKMAQNPLAYFESQPEEFVKLYGLDQRTTPYSPMEAYRRLAGEAEARATQARIPLDASQRRAIFPEDSYDVPVNQLIVRGLLDR